jgi:hypothetical protein
MLFRPHLVAKIHSDESSKKTSLKYYKRGGSCSVSSKSKWEVVKSSGTRWQSLTVIKTGGAS